MRLSGWKLWVMREGEITGLYRGLSYHVQWEILTMQRNGEKCKKAITGFFTGNYFQKDWNFRLKIGYNSGCNIKYIWLLKVECLLIGSMDLYKILN